MLLKTLNASMNFLCQPKQTNKKKYIEFLSRRFSQSWMEMRKEKDSKSAFIVLAKKNFAEIRLTGWWGLKGNETLIEIN